MLRFLAIILAFTFVGYNDAKTTTRGPGGSSNARIPDVSTGGVLGMPAKSP
jgi:hypothetical protein